MAAITGQIGDNGGGGGEFEVWGIFVDYRSTLLMEMGLLHNYFGIFPIHVEKYYICMEGSMQGEIEMNISPGGGGAGSLARF